MEILYGLLGKNISYSFSLNYFNQKFKLLNFEKYQYKNFDIQNIEEIKEVLSNNSNLKGLNVTIPYKESIIPYLDKISKKAKKIGAVNCIKISKKGKLKGYNTDWYGFYKTIIPYRLENQKALIFGTGGASKAVQFALKKLNIKYLVVSRNPNKKQLSYKDITENDIKKFTILINCTPLGTFPDVNNCISIPYNCVTEKHIAYDLIYNPEISKFLKKCKHQGSKIINGYDMLVAQAELSFEIWNK
ncbi:MAG: shikimate dehydrogenase family protein [Flavobacterium sp.]